ncbi:YfbR-like 5'-deoxynucleotidase [Novosphingobium sp. NPDC080210]|uniref:YfbR-like 5'-deoxynucleotidase n=1 Tax=Novosphingobium sp. NPDC080210 TaxID=3390596 RepID=UPI003D072CA4
MITGPVIATYSRGYFNFADPDATPLEILDIARGLANTCRYGGQIGRFYSVAEHSVHASHLVAEEHAYAALMHDATEAVIGDMVKPLKEILPDYQAIEERIEASIFKTHGVPNPLPQAVKVADIQMLILEKEQLKGNFDEWSWCQGVPRPQHRRLECWTPAEAFSRFMARYSQLRGSLAQGN